MNISTPQNNPKKNDTTKITIEGPSKFLVLVMLLVVAFLFAWFIVLPKWRSYNLAKIQLADLKAQRDALTTQEQTLNDLVSTLRVHEGDVTHLNQALPLDGKTINLQTTLQILAQSSGVTIGDINFPGNSGEVVAGNTPILLNPYAVNRSLRTLTGSVNVSGSYDQLMALIKKLESNGRLIDIQSIEMSSQKDNLIDLKISAQAYYYE